MARPKVSQYGTEIFYSDPAAKGRVSQYGIEVFYSGSLPSPLGSTVSVGADGDECNSGSIDAAWTLRNITSVSGDGTQYCILLDAQGDAITRAFTDPGSTGFNIVGHFKNLTSFAGMIGVMALDSSNNGVGFSPYSDGNSYIWNLSSYNYSTTGPSVGSAPSGGGDLWVHLQRVGTNGYRGRYSQDGFTWSSWSGTQTDARTVTKIGVGRFFTNGGNQTLLLERFLSVSPDITGAAVSQYGVEVFYQTASPEAVVSQYGVEVFYVEPDPAPTSGSTEHSHVFVG